MVSALPASTADISIEWFRDVVQDHPDFAGCEILDIKTAPLGVGIGQVSSMAHITPTYAEKRGPVHVVAKLQTDFAPMHELAMRYGSYEREVSCYNELCSTLAVRTPRIYYAAFDRGTERAAILQEDFSDWFNPNQTQGPTIAQADAIVDTLVELSASHWDGDFTGMPWLNHAGNDVFHSLVTDYEQCIDGMIANFGHVLDEDGINAARRICRNFPWLLVELQKPPLTLAHFDYRLENFFFRDPTSTELVLIDWQMTAQLSAGYDFAYFLGTNLPLPMRRENEVRLLNRYKQGLAAAEVSFDEDALDFTIGIGYLAMSCVAVIAGASLDVSVPRSKELGESVVSRTFASILEGGYLALLPDR